MSDSLEESATKNSSAKTLLILSIIANVILALFSGYIVQLNFGQKSQIEDLTTSLNEVMESIRLMEQQLNMSTTQLEYYMELADYYSNQTTYQNGAPSVLGHSVIPIVAVRTIQKGFNIEYEGIVLEAEIELVEGSGRILVNTVPMIGIDIQSSVRTAVLVVEELTSVSLSQTDVVLTIRGTQEVEIVDGGSAGASITVALLAAVNNQDVKGGIYMTGTIKNDKAVGEIGGVAYKALAVAELGAEKFLVPEGQATIVVYKPKTVKFFGTRITTYERSYMDLEDYLLEQGYTLNVIEVESIEQAYEIFFS